MAHSFSRNISFTCAVCDATFRDTIWMIIDVQERPDLLLPIKRDTLHLVYCPYCGTVLACDVPLLIFNPDDTHPLLYSPIEDDTDEEIENAYRALTATLRRSMGDEWDEAWVESDPPYCPREMLPFMVAEGIEEKMDAANALAEVYPEHYGGLAAVVAEITELYGPLQSLPTFVEAQDPSEMKQILRDHPELVHGDQKMLEVFVQAIMAECDGDITDKLAERMALLQRCREIGIDAALDEFMKDEP